MTMNMQRSTGASLSRLAGQSLQDTVERLEAVCGPLEGELAPHLQRWPLLLHSTEQCLIIVWVMSTLLPHHPNQTLETFAHRDVTSLSLHDEYHSTLC